jgi:hypothetical protein
VLGANRVLAVALITHFIISLVLFAKSVDFTNELKYDPSDPEEVRMSISLFKFFTAYQNPDRNKFSM